jgi:hypothetical protein
MFDGRRFRDVAETLASRIPDEPFDRTAIGRYYYAAFWAARTYGRSRGETFRSTGTHTQIIEWFRVQQQTLPGGSRSRDVAGWLRDLQTMRTRADYAEVVHHCRRDIRTARKLCENILAAIGER